MTKSDEIREFESLIEDIGDALPKKEDGILESDTIDNTRLQGNLGREVRGCKQLQSDINRIFTTVNDGYSRVDDCVELLVELALQDNPVEFFDKLQKEPLAEDMKVYEHLGDFVKKEEGFSNIIRRKGPLFQGVKGLANQLIEQAQKASKERASGIRELLMGMSKQSAVSDLVGRTETWIDTLTTPGGKFDQLAESYKQTLEEVGGSNSVVKRQYDAFRVQIQKSETLQGASVSYSSQSSDPWLRMYSGGNCFGFSMAHMRGGEGFVKRPPPVTFDLVYNQAAQFSVKGSAEKQIGSVMDAVPLMEHELADLKHGDSLGIVFRPKSRGGHIVSLKRIDKDEFQGYEFIDSNNVRIRYPWKAEDVAKFIADHIKAQQDFSSGGVDPTWDLELEKFQQSKPKSLWVWLKNVVSGKKREQTLEKKLQSESNDRREMALAKYASAHRALPKTRGELAKIGKAKPGTVNLSNVDNLVPYFNQTSVKGSSERIKAFLALNKVSQQVVLKKLSSDVQRSLSYSEHESFVPEGKRIFAKFSGAWLAEHEMNEHQKKLLALALTQGNREGKEPTPEFFIDNNPNFANMRTKGTNVADIVARLEKADKDSQKSYKKDLLETMLVIEKAPNQFPQDHRAIQIACEKALDWLFDNNYQLVADSGQHNKIVIKCEGDFGRGVTQVYEGHGKRWFSYLLKNHKETFLTALCDRMGADRLYFNGESQSAQRQDFGSVLKSDPELAVALLEQIRQDITAKKSALRGGNDLSTTGFPGFVEGILNEVPPDKASTFLVEIRKNETLYAEVKKSKQYFAFMGKALCQRGYPGVKKWLTSKTASANQKKIFLSVWLQARYPGNQERIKAVMQSSSITQMRDVSDELLNSVFSSGSLDQCLVKFEIDCRRSTSNVVEFAHALPVLDCLRQCDNPCEVEKTLSKTQKAYLKKCLMCVVNTPSSHFRNPNKAELLDSMKDLGVTKEIEDEVPVNSKMAARVNKYLSSPSSGLAPGR